MPSQDDADELQTALAKLITAHHILHQQGFLSSSSSGGVYVRNPLNHNVFFSSDMVGTAPGLVEGRADLRGWNVGDGTPLTHPLANIPITPAAHIPHTSEHHIAASLLHKYPSLNSIIHISPSPLLSFAAPGSPSLRGISNRAAFLGSSVPVFDIGKRYPKASAAGSVAGYLGGLVRGGSGGEGVVEKGHAHDMCVDTKGLGDALAEAFVLPASAGASALEMAKSLSLTTNTADKGAGERKLPDFAVMLLRGNGAVIVATSIEEAVYRAILTVENAMMQKDAMLMHAALTSSTDFSLVSKGGGSGQHGEGRGEKMEVVNVGAREWDGGLAADEMRDAIRTGNGEVVGKAWKGWVREIRRSGAYVNEMDELVGGRR